MLFLAFLLAAAQAPPIVPIAKLFGNATVWEVRVSPAGDRIAYLKAVRGKMNIFVRPLAGGPDRAVTHDSAGGIDEYRWSADGHRLIYLKDNGGDEGYHLFAVDADAPATPRDLTPFPQIVTELLALPASTPGVAIVTLNKRNPQLADAYRLDLATGALTMAAQNPGTFLGYVADGANQVRAAYSVDTVGQYHLWTRATERDAWRDLQTFPVEDKITPLRFHPDGHRIYMLSNHGSDLMRLVLKDVVTGAEMEVDQDPLGEADIDAAIFDPANGELLATRYIGDTVRWYPKTIATWRLVAAARLTGRSLSEIGDGSRSGAKWTFRVESPTDPGAIFSFDAKSGRAQVLFELFPDLKGTAFARTVPVKFNSRDGLTLHGYLTLPPGLEPRALPLLVDVHGGPWSRDVPGFDPETQLHANRGYAVLQVNYRGSTGYGKKFARAARHEFGRAMLNDLLDGAQWTVAAGTVDPRRIAITGGSYGGYAALAGITFAPDAFVCAAEFAGPSDLVTLMESFPPSWAPFLPRLWYPMAGDPHHADDSAMLVSRSPIHRVDSARVPLLIFQGVNDPRVTQAQSDRIALALHARGVPVTYLLASNTGHNFGDAATSLAVNRATEIFFAQCLGGRVEANVDSVITRTIAELTVNLDSLSKNSASRP